MFGEDPATGGECPQFQVSQPKSLRFQKLSFPNITPAVLIVQYILTLFLELFSRKETPKMCQGKREYARVMYEGRDSKTKATSKASRIEIVRITPSPFPTLCPLIYVAEVIFSPISHVKHVSHRIFRVYSPSARDYTRSNSHSIAVSLLYTLG